MQIFLPIAEVSVNIFLILGLGGLVGILSGMFGVGGGFLITPLLLFIGIPPAVAVATSANQIVASSVSGVLAHLRRKTVDFRMGGVLLAGGILGAVLGVGLFNRMKSLGNLDFFVSLLYVVFLGTIGALMFIEALASLRRARRGGTAHRHHKHSRLQALPLKMKFRTSGLYISVLPVLASGLVVGVLSAVMGVGGGFIMVPAMIYILGMPTKVVIGTSLFQIIFVSSCTTILQAFSNHSVDIVLALLLIGGGAVGAQIGSRIGFRLKADQLRLLLAGLVLLVALRLGGALTVTPADSYFLGG